MLAQQSLTWACPSSAPACFQLNHMRTTGCRVPMHCKTWIPVADTQVKLSNYLTFFPLKYFSNIYNVLFHKISYISNTCLTFPTTARIGTGSQLSIHVYIYHPPTTTLNFLTSSRHSRRLKLGIQLNQTKGNPNLKKKNLSKKSLKKSQKKSLTKF